MIHDVRVDDPFPVEVKDDEDLVAGREQLVELHLSDELVGRLRLQSLVRAAEDAHLHLLDPFPHDAEPEDPGIVHFQDHAFRPCGKGRILTLEAGGEEEQEKAGQGQSQGQEGMSLVFHRFHFPEIRLGGGVP